MAKTHQQKCPLFSFFSLLAIVKTHKIIQSATDENPEDAAAKNEQLQQLIRVVRQVQAAEQLNQLNQAADQKVEASEPESKTPGLDELSLDDEEDGEDRNKR